MTLSAMSSNEALAVALSLKRSQSLMESFRDVGYCETGIKWKEHHPELYMTGILRARYSESSPRSQQLKPNRQKVPAELHSEFPSPQT